MKEGRVNWCSVLDQSGRPPHMTMQKCVLHREQQCCPWPSKLKLELIVYPYLGEESDNVVACPSITQ